MRTRSALRVQVYERKVRPTVDNKEWRPKLSESERFDTQALPPDQQLPPTKPGGDLDEFVWVGRDMLRNTEG